MADFREKVDSITQIGYFLTCDKGIGPFLKCLDIQLLLVSPEFICQPVVVQYISIFNELLNILFGFFLKVYKATVVVFLRAFELRALNQGVVQMLAYGVYFGC